jgi:hypothetical protein
MLGMDSALDRRTPVSIVCDATRAFMFSDALVMLASVWIR